MTDDEQHDLEGTFDTLVKRIYDALPPDPECQRLFLKWKAEFKAISKSKERLPESTYRECSATYAELIANMAIEGVEKY